MMFSWIRNVEVGSNHQELQDLQGIGICSGGSRGKRWRVWRTWEQENPKITNKYSLENTVGAIWEQQLQLGVGFAHHRSGECRDLQEGLKGLGKSSACGLLKSTTEDSLSRQDPKRNCLEWIKNWPIEQLEDQRTMMR